MKVVRTYLSEHIRRDARLLEELDGILASNDTEAIRIGLGEQLAVESLLLWVEVQDRMV